MTASNRAERLEGLPMLPGAFMGSLEPMQLLQEARACFVEGYYMTAILAATAHVEHTLVEELQARGVIGASESPSFEVAIKKASALFGPDALRAMDQLRKIRNPLTHRKADGHPDAIGTRFRAEKRSPQEVLEDGAKLALDVMHGVFFATLRPFDSTAD